MERIKRKSHNVVCEVVRGTSQELAVDTRADETLCCGTRGSMKTISQLLAFLKYVGRGYGHFWRGVIFDQEYRFLDDIILKSKQIFSQLGGEYNISEKRWTFPTGESLIFRIMKTDDDYWRFHGHEYCLPDNEKIATNKGLVAIKDVEVGTLVKTLNGYKPVIKKFDVGVKDCVKVEVYTLDGHLRCVQQQSVNHRLLTTAGVWQKSSSRSFQSVLLSDEMLDRQEEVCKLPHDVCQENLAFFAQQVCAETSAILSDMLHQNVLPNLVSLQALTLNVVLLLNNLSKLRDLPTSSRNELVSSVLSLVNKVNRLGIRLGRQHFLKQLVQRHLCGKLNLNVQQLNDCVVLRKVASLLYHCFHDFCQYGVLAHRDKESVQLLVPLLHDVIKHSPENSLGDLVGGLLHSRLCQFAFWHPYQKDKLCRSNLELSLGFVRVHSLHKLHCFDVEVECTNHYITQSGLVNKNCFIGFNELSKYPTSYLYDTIQSCNRSGFVPELNPVYDPITKKMLILPPIPLMVFSTTNPYGAGHFWVKKRFIDVAPYGHIVYRDTEVYNPATDEVITMRRSQVAIFSSYIENPFLSPKYIAGLVNHPDPNIRAAWAMGSWDITAGGMFGDLWRRERHVIPRFAIPKNWFINRTFDWGSSHPFSVGWWAQANGEEVDVLLDNGTWTKFAPPAGSLIQIYEYYGTNEIGTNKGLQLGARQIAKDIVAIEHALYDSDWLESEIHAGAADNQIWNKINDDTPSIADLMASERVTWLNSNKSAGSRINGAQIMRDMLEDTLKNNVERPHIYFMSNCVSSIATLPILPRDTKKLDDVDTNAEDHCWDMTRYRLLQGIEDGSITARVRY